SKIIQKLSAEPPPREWPSTLATSARMPIRSVPPVFGWFASDGELVAADETAAVDDAGRFEGADVGVLGEAPRPHAARTVAPGASAIKPRAARREMRAAA